MPNGGSDCCGTCWFNSKNEGEPGYHGSKKEGIAVCQIRDIEIQNSFYTYCTNHPHHNPNRITVPIGPVYVDEDRRILHEAPDDEQTRKLLVSFLKSMEETPQNEYPAGVPIDEQAIIQVGNLKEKRATPYLRRILSFNPNSKPPGKNPFNRNRVVTIGLAIENLAKIEENNALEDIEKLITLGLEGLSKRNYNPKEDNFAAVRYHAVRGLKYTKGDKTMELLKLGMADYHKEIRAFAKDILASIIGQNEAEAIEGEIERGLNNQVTTPKWWEFWKKNQ